MASPLRSPSKQLPLILLVLAALAAVTPAAAAQQQQEYCRDTLAGLMECQGFMHGDASAVASASCCAAYEAAFDADPFCLCYVADGTFARATGNGVDVARALQIPVSCGQAAPPIELCSMQGLVLPPYEPKGTPAVTAAPEASAPAMQPPSGGSVAPPLSFTTPPPPPPTSAADPVLSASSVIILIAALATAMA